MLEKGSENIAQRVFISDGYGHSPECLTLEIPKHWLAELKSIFGKDNTHMLCFLYFPPKYQFLFSVRDSMNVMHFQKCVVKKVNFIFLS